MGPASYPSTTTATAPFSDQEIARRIEACPKLAGLRQIRELSMATPVIDELEQATAPACLGELTSARWMT